MSLAVQTPHESEQEFKVWQFVERYYNEFLGRAADFSGLQDWADRLLAKELSGVETAEGFFTSEEFQNAELTDTDYVNTLYRAFFDRLADESGLEKWTGRLAEGYSKQHVFNGLAVSDEFSKLCENYGIDRGEIVLTLADQVPHESEQEYQVWQFVERFYTEVLGRGADLSGLESWANKLIARTSTGAEVAKGFVFSEEFIDMEKSEEDFVHIMYRAFFGRTADAAGFNSWMEQFAANAEREDIFAGFINSIEFGTLCEAYGIEQGGVSNGIGPTPTPDDNPGGNLDAALGTLETVTANLGEKLKENNINFRIYSASVAPISQFKTAEGGYGVAYHGSDTITILLYDRELNLQGTIEIETEGGQIGAVTCDASGSFYVVYGITNETDDISKEVMRIVKYSAKGKKLASVSYTGEETGAYGSDFGTKIPFRSANCSVAVKNGLLVCTYGRQMYSGHQASNSLYVETETMEKADISSIYTSHSFDQQVIPTWDGGFLFADHGDAYGRSFTVSKLLNGGSYISYELESFHFREGTNRDYGYNETYAQLGGLAELPNAYVLVAASERTLSLDTAPTNREYCGYSEPRDLFIQYLKKDYGEYSGVDCYAVEGETRTAVGTHPTDALTPLRLPDDVEDYGVIWLTNYTGEEMVYNPKVATTETGEVIVLWSKTLFSKQKIEDTYYMILDNEGNILQEATSIGAVPLSKDEPVVYIDGSIYWSVSAGKELTTYRFVVSEDILGGLKDDVTWQVFDADYYLEKYPALEEIVGTDEVELYLYWINAGMQLGQSATPVLVTWEYMQLNPELAAELDYDHLEVLRHFFEHGIYEGLRGSREFDYEVYAQYNPDVYELCGDDIVAYYEHYVKHGREEGRTASADTGAEKPEELGEITVVPEGTRKFMTPDGRVIAMFFENGRIVRLEFYTCTGLLEEKLRYYYWDEEGKSYDIRDGNYNTVVDYWTYSGGEVVKTEDASNGSFEYVEILSVNEDGTLTVHLKEVKAGTSTTYYFTEEGELDSYSISEYENGKVVISTDYTSDNVIEYWHEYEYYENGKIKKCAGYFGAGTDKLSQIYEFYENGNYKKSAQYYYSENGVLNMCNLSEYDTEGNYIYSQDSLYDAAGNLVNYSEERYENDKIVTLTNYTASGAVVNWYSYEYYDSGVRKKSVKYLGEGTDKLSSVDEYYENGNDKREEDYFYDSETGKITSSRLFLYDEEETVLERTRCFYTYKNGVLSGWEKEVYSYSDGVLSEKRFYTYDADGNLLEEYYYDSAGNLITVFPNY